MESQAARRQVDMCFEAYNFQSKFVCDHVDHGPISSCVGATASAGKSESELMEMAKQKTAEDEADDTDYLKENPSFVVRFKHWLQNKETIPLTIDSTKTPFIYYLHTYVLLHV